MKSIILTIVFISGLLTTSAHAQTINHLNEMINSFSANCSSNGNFTQGALQTVNSLVSILESLKSDCKSASSAIADLELAAQQLNYLNEKNSYTERELMGLRARQSKIFHLLSTVTDPVEEEILKADLRNTTLSISQNRGRDRGEDQNLRRQRLTQAMALVASSTRSVFDRLAQNQSCWRKHPSLVSELATFGAAVGESIALGVGTGGMSNVIGTGIELSAGLINFLHERKQAREIRNMSVTVEPVALSCALESMTNQWCEAQDTIDAVNLVSKGLVQAKPEDAIWNGIRLLERELPILVGWLEKVRAGSPSGNSAIANQRADLFEQDQELRTLEDLVIGLAAQEKRTFPSDVNEKWAIVKNLINTITRKAFYDSNGRASNSPLNKVRTHDSARFLLIGIDDGDPRLPALRTRMQQQSKSFGTLDLSDLSAVGINYKPDLDDVVENFRTWLKQGKTRFQAFRDTVLFDDPILIFDEASSRSFSGNQKGSSPRASIEKLIQFVSDNVPDEEKRGIYLDTKKRLQTILDTIQQVNFAKESDERDCKSSIDFSNLGCPLQGLETISTSAKLINGTLFLQNRIQHFIKIVIENQVVNHKGLSQKQALHFLASRDIIARIKSFTGESSLRAIKADAIKGQSIIQKSLFNFVDLFDKQIYQSLREYDRMIRKFDETENDANYKAKVIFCLNLLSIPDWKFTMGLNRCIGSMQKSLFPSAPSSPVFDRNIFRKTKFQKRICQYRNFKRKTDLIQSLAERDLIDEAKLSKIRAEANSNNSRR